MSENSNRKIRKMIQEKNIHHIHTHVYERDCTCEREERKKSVYVFVRVCVYECIVEYGGTEISKYVCYERMQRRCHSKWIAIFQQWHFNVSNIYRNFYFGHACANQYLRAKIFESLLLCFEYEKGILDLELEHTHG